MIRINRLNCVLRPSKMFHLYIAASPAIGEQAIIMTFAVRCATNMVWRATPTVKWDIGFQDLVLKTP